MAETGEDAKTIKLDDGRTLGFAEYGNPASSTKILYFHGMPSSRLEAAPQLSHLNLNAHIVAIDRPGFGLSTFQPKRKLLDWPRDILEVVKRLAWTRYSILAVSAGGPYALACAKALPAEQVLGIAVVAGMPPTLLGKQGMSWGQSIAWWITTWMPCILRPAINLLYLKPVRDKDPTVLAKLIKAGVDASPPADKKAVEGRDDVMHGLTAAVREAFRSGSEGYVHESKLICGDYQFKLEDIQYEGVQLWYGEEDSVCPAVLGQNIAARLPKAKFTTFPQTGHLGIMFLHGQEIIDSLLSTRPSECSII